MHMTGAISTCQPKSLLHHSGLTEIELAEKLSLCDRVNLLCDGVDRARRGVEVFLILKGIGAVDGGGHGGY